ncbi:agamous-like MADS-box protein AGL29 [Primulina tabacum]|uniref:agamous-like MADS-box protein AGL29 n=1 Tax=Primulina tabacum TaxID=48773 RepID=UPI003F5AAD18
MKGEGSRQSRGRQKIPMQLIENQDDMYATFSKRRLGIYKKATELCTLCDVDIGIIMFSPTDVPYSFFHPRMDSVVSRSMNPGQPQSDFDRIIDSHTHGKVEGMNQELDRIIASKDAESVRWQRAMEEIRTRNIWMRQRLDTLTLEQALLWRAWFKELKTRVTRRIEQIKNQASSSAMPPLPPPDAGENVEDMVVAARTEGADNVHQPAVMPPGQFGFPGQTSNDPNLGGGAPPALYYLTPPPLEEQNMFAGGTGPSQELNLGPPGGAPSYTPYYVPPPPPPDFLADPQFYFPLPPPPPPPPDPASGAPSNQD